MRTTGTRHARDGMVLMGAVVLLGIAAIATTVAVQDLVRCRFQVHRHHSQIQARWLAHATVEQWIADRLNGEPERPAPAVATQAAATRGASTQAASTQPGPPPPLGIEGAETVTRTQAVGDLVRLRCLVRMPDTRSRFVIIAFLRVRPDRVDVVRWEEE